MKLKTILTLITASVWLANGLFCKLFDVVPRHRQIVARLLGEDHASLFTKTIGALEIMMAIWIVCRIRPRWCTIAQIVLVATMNVIEFILAPDLLLFGRFNILVAFVFTVALFLNEFVLNRNTVNPDGINKK